MTPPDVPTAPARLECRVARGPLSVALLGAGVFVVLGIAILTGAIGGGPTPVDVLGGKVIGALCVLFFGGISVFALVSIAKSGGGPVLVIDDEGLFDRRIGPRPIPWSEIRGAEKRTGPTLPSLFLTFIELDVAEPDRFRRSSSKVADRLNKLYGFKPLVLSTAVLDHGIDEVLAAIRSHL